MPPHADYVRIRTGLLEAKHVEKLGGGPWPLYLYLQGIVKLRGDGAGTTFPDQPYTHSDAASYMGQPVPSIRRWFGVLLAEGYITTAPHRRGLTVSIANFGAERTAERSSDADARMITSDHPHDAPRVITSEQAPAIVGDQISTDGCSDLSARVIRSERLGDQKRSPTSPTTNGARALQENQENKRFKSSAPAGTPASARPLTEHQQLVNAYLEGLGRDPTTAHDYKRHVAAGAELARNGHTLADVRCCTKWLCSDPWRRSKGRPPTLADVAVALPGWIADGRPGNHVAAAKGAAGGRPTVHAAQEAARERVEHLFAAGRDQRGAQDQRRLTDG